MGWARVLASQFPAAYIEVAAEDRFRKAVMLITSEIPLETWRKMAAAGVSLLSLLPQGVLPRWEVRDLDRPGVEYLLSLSDERLLELSQEVAPEHAALLADYPVFRGKLSSDLRQIVAGKLGGGL
jgi:hypothetical protein